MRSSFMSSLAARLFAVLLLVVVALVALPTLSIWQAWWGLSANDGDILAQMGQTVLPDYSLTTLALGVVLGVGVALLGGGSALLMTLWRFRGQRVLGWALVLPLAMPAYVVAYAYTDFLQFSGPAQTWLRSTFGWQGALWPDVRSTWGAVAVFSLTLYPYVYLLARTALSEQGQHMLDAARLLGASRGRQIRTIALPLARPALAAGVALALMETLADYGVSSYFGIQTFTAGIYKAWLAMDNAAVAAQLATVLLTLVVALLWWERKAQSRMRFHANKPSRSAAAPALTRGPAAWGLLALGVLPVLLGFVGPMGILLGTWLSNPVPLDLRVFAGWGGNSLYLAGLTALLAVSLAWGLAAQQRLARSVWSRTAAHVIGLGYAIPGAVVVVGILLPTGWLQATAWGQGLAPWVTTTALGLVWAYLVRFTAVAMQSMDSGYSRLPRAMDEASRTLGVTGWQLWRRLHWPLMNRTFWAATLLVFVDVMKELPATLVLRPFDSDTLAVVTYQLARDERLGEAALPALTLVLFGLIPVWLITRQGQGHKSN